MEIPVEIEAFVTARPVAEVIAKMKEGTEAQVCLCRAHPDTGQTPLSAKMHRAFEHHRFRDDSVVREWRVVGSRTIAKAMTQHSRFGQQMLRATTWLEGEYRALRDRAEAGVHVPTVFGRADRARLLAFIGSPVGAAAPPLRAVHPPSKRHGTFGLTCAIRWSVLWQPTRCMPTCRPATSSSRDARPI